MKRLSNMNFIEHLFFNFTYKNNTKEFDKFYLTLAEEIKLIRNNYQFKVKTIYIATNDFILFNSQQLTLLLKLINSFVDENLIEYSFEIGYQTLKLEQLIILKQYKINRLVWKVRTFNKRLLRNINQNFDSHSIQKLIKDSFLYGYQNFSLDLEDNIEYQTEADIISDLKSALAFKTPHISYQSHTDFYNKNYKKIIIKFLRQNNYHNYEFFSFALNKSYYSQQTLAYLSLKNWYGLGPNANSFLKFNNQIINIRNSNKIPWTNKLIHLNDYFYSQLLLTQNLMLKEGILIANDFWLLFKPFRSSINKLIKEGYLEVENYYLKTTNKGWILLNDVLIDIISTKY